MAMVTSRGERSTRAGTTAASWAEGGGLAARGGGGAARARGHARPIRQPARHRGRPLQLPQAGAVVGVHGVADAGLQPIPQSDRGGEGVAVERDVECLYGGPQLLEHALYRTRVRLPVQAKSPA